MCNRYDSQEEDVVLAGQESAAHRKIVEVGIRCMDLRCGHRDKMVAD